MTTNTRKLGRRQVDVLRAAAAGNLVRFDSGTWDAPSGACTASAKSVAARGWLVEAGRMYRYTLGAGSEPGTTMRLSAEGKRVLQEWELANPEPVVADWRQRQAIRALAGLTGDALVAGVRDLAATDTGVGDGEYTVVSQALRGEQPDLPTGNDPWCSDCGCGIGDHDVVTDDLGERVECRVPGCRCRISTRSA